MSHNNKNDLFFPDKHHSFPEGGVADLFITKLLQIKHNPPFVPFHPACKCCALYECQVLAVRQSPPLRQLPHYQIGLS
jgi:hypothetical protein